MAITANIHAAKSQLSKLIEAALEGEEVIIQKAGASVARLLPFDPARMNRDLREIISVSQEPMGAAAADGLPRSEKYLSELVDEVERTRQPVTVTRYGREIVRIVPIEAALVDRQPGAWRGKIRLAPDFDEIPTEMPTDKAADQGNESEGE